MHFGAVLMEEVLIAAVRLVGVQVGASVRLVAVLGMTLVHRVQVWVPSRRKMEEELLRRMDSVAAQHCVAADRQEPTKARHPAQVRIGCLAVQ